LGCFTFEDAKKGEVSEDFSFTQLSESLSFEPYSGYCGSFGFRLYGFSFDGFSANPLWKKTPLYAGCVATVGYFTVFFGPSAPDIVSTKHQRIFAAFEESAIWGTMF